MIGDEDGFQSNITSSYPAASSWPGHRHIHAARGDARRFAHDQDGEVDSLRLRGVRRCSLVECPNGRGRNECG